MFREGKVARDLDFFHEPLIAAVLKLSPDGEVVEIVCRLILLDGRTESSHLLGADSPLLLPNHVLFPTGLRMATLPKRMKALRVVRARSGGL